MRKADRKLLTEVFGEHLAGLRDHNGHPLFVTYGDGVVAGLVDAVETVLERT